MTTGGPSGQPASAQSRLATARRVFLDTAPIIYYFEANAAYVAALDPFFRRLDDGGVEAVTSPVTLAECLIHPLRRGDSATAELFMSRLISAPGVRFTPIDAVIGRRAAGLRAGHNLSLTDALQLATAAASGCDAMLTNDTDLARCALPQLDVVLVSQLRAEG